MKYLKIFVLTIIIIGVVFVVWGLVVTDDLTDLVELYDSSSQYEKMEGSGSEVISGVDISVDVRDVSLFFSEDETYRLEYYEAEKDKITISIVDGILKVENKVRFWFHWGYISSEVCQMDVYLPASFKDSIDVETATGDVIIADFELTSLKIEVNTGDIEINNCNISDALEIDTDTGDVSISKVSTASTIIHTDTGRISIDDSESQDQMDLKTATGDVYIKDGVADKIVVRTSTGDIKFTNVSCPDLILHASTGDINVDLLGSSQDYRLKLRTDTDDITFQGNKYEYKLEIGQGSKYLEATTSAGWIKVNIH